MEVGQLVIEEVRPVEGAPPVQLLAIDPEGAPIDQMNGGFALRFEADGVYLELLPPRGQGLPIDRGGLQERLSRKGVSGLDRPLLEACWRAGWAVPALRRPSGSACCRRRPWSGCRRTPWRRRWSCCPPSRAAR